MASPFDFFRRNQKIWMAALAVMAMFAFVIFDPVDMSQLGRGGGGGEVNPLIVRSHLGDLRLEDLRQKILRRDQVFMFLDQCVLYGVTDQMSGIMARMNAFPLLQPLMMRPSTPETIVENMLLAHEAELLGMDVSDAEITRFLNRISSTRDFQAVLALVNGTSVMPLTDNHVFDVLRTELLANRMRDMFQQTAMQTTPAQRWDYYQRLRVTATAEMLAVPVDQFLASVGEPNDAELTAFFNQYKQDEPVPGSDRPGFKIPQTIRVQFLRADFAKFFDPKAISAEEVQKYYDEHLAEFPYRGLISLPEPPPTAEPPAGTLPPEGAAPTGTAAPPAGTAAPTGTAPATGTAPVSGTAAPTGTPPAAGTAPAPGKTDGSQRGTPRSRLEREVAARRPREPGGLLALADEPAASPAPTVTASPTGPSLPTGTAAPTGTTSPSAPAAGTPSPTATAPPVSTTPAATSAPADPTAAPPAATAPTGTAAAAPTGTAAAVTVEPPPKLSEEWILPRDIRGGPNPPQAPLWQVEQEIRHKLAEEAARKRLAELFDTLMGAMNEHASRDFGDQRYPDPMDLKPLAEKFQLEAVNDSGPFTALEFEARLPGLAAAEVVGADRLPSRPMRLALFRELRPFQPAEAVDRDNNRYLFWKTSDEPPRVPDLKEPEIRKQVIAAWKRIEARRAALDEANRLADEARQKKVPLAELAKTRPELKVIVTPSFTWMTEGLTGGIRSGGSLPELSEIPGIEDAGDELFRAVFSLEAVRDVAVAMNNPKTIAYVVQLTSRSPSRELLQETFLADSFMTYGSVGVPENRGDYQAWIERIEQQNGLTWVEKPDPEEFQLR